MASNEDYDALVAEMLQFAHQEYQRIVARQREAGQQRMKTQPVQYVLQAYAAAVESPSVLSITQFILEAARWTDEVLIESRYQWEITRGMGTYQERILKVIEQKQVKGGAA